MLLRLLPLLAGLGPLLAAYLAFWIGVSNDVLPACIPFIDGCASISAAGRKPPGSYLFRAVMLPQSVLLLMTWLFAIAWLRSLDANVNASLIRGIRVSAIVSSIALVSYVTFLGTREPFYEFMRYFGIYFFFLGMVLVELFLAIALLRMPVIRDNRRYRLPAQSLLALCLAPFVIGLVNVLLKASLDDPDAAENVIEWIAATLMHIYLLVLYVLWQRTQFSASLTTRIS